MANTGSGTARPAGAQNPPAQGGGRAVQEPTALAMLKKDTVDIVAAKVRQYQERGELHFPPNYSPDNAMKSAWLTLQGTVNRDNKPALEVCTRDSIANSLLDMVIQGLNPAKKQCYFIVYGNKLACQRSYFGSEAILKSIIPGAEVWAEVVYAGDEFTYEIKKGRKTITKHVQAIANVIGKNIVAAYAIIEFPGDRPDHVEVMTIAEIKQAWAQGQGYKPDGNGTHQKFPEEMAKKTVIQRACKAFINSSNDANLLLKQAANRADEIRAETEVEEEIAAHANGEIIDIEGGPVSDSPPAGDQPSDLKMEAPKQAGGPSF